MCLGDLLAVLIDHVALDVAGFPSTIDDPSFDPQTRLPDWAEEIDVEGHRCKGFVGRHGGHEGEAHRRVRDVAQHAAVKRAHRVRVLWTGAEREDGAAVADLHDVEPDELCDRDLRGDRFLNQRMDRPGRTGPAGPAHGSPFVVDSQSLWILDVTDTAFEARFGRYPRRRLASRPTPTSASPPHRLTHRKSAPPTGRVPPVLYSGL